MWTNGKKPSSLLYLQQASGEIKSVEKVPE